MNDPQKFIPAMTGYLVLAALLLLVSTAGAAAAPAAAFNGTPALGTSPPTVNFTDASTGSPTGWAWFFGDETYTQPWTEQTPSSGWSRRNYARSVAMPDGSIVLMGGFSGRTYLNDTWRSTDNGKTWMQQTASSGWSARVEQSCVAMPDGSIVLMGGAAPNGTYLNDTWRSTDYGKTWTLVNANSGWPARVSHASVAMPDGTIILLGGYDGSSGRNDVWRSTDYGVTWTQLPDAAWSPRSYLTAVVMPDRSIVLMAGVDSDGYAKNDVWRSTDNGVSWTQANASPGWLERRWHGSVAMPDGSIVMMGGGGLNDTWRFQPAGSTLQNPSHTYTEAGTYSVALQAFNAAGYSSTRKTSVAVAPMPSVPTAGNAPRDLTGDGLYKDVNGNGALDFNDVVIYFNQIDWIADNEPVGAFDFNRNGQIDFNDIVMLFNEL